MIRIAIILILSSLTNGYSHNDKKLDLRELHDSLLGVSLFTRERILKNDSAIFLGNTKAGKSTIINHIIRNELIGKRYSAYKSIEVIAKNESLGPKIGRGSLSETLMPSNWTSKLLPNLTLWDTPSFDDNRGTVRDITNSFYLYNLLKKVKSIKIVLVVDISDITQDNTQQFVSLITSIGKLFGNEFKKFFNSTTIIFTKLPNTTSDGYPIDKEYIKYHLENHLLLDNGLQFSEDLKSFIRFLMNNDGRVAFFKRVFNEGIITDDIVDNIVPAIRDSESMNSSFLQNILPTISSSSMLELLKCQQISQATLIIKEIEKLLLKKLNTTRNHLEHLSNRTDNNEISKIKENLTKDLNIFKQSLISNNNLTKKVDCFINIESDINATVKQNLTKNVELIQNVESILNVDISQSLVFNVDSCLLVLILKYNASVSLADLKLGFLTIEAFNKTISDHEKKSDSINTIDADLNNLNNSPNQSWYNMFMEKVRKIIATMKSWIFPHK